MASQSDWDASASAWIASMGEHGDWARRYVIDPALDHHLSNAGFRKALDVGCGEGRLCRKLQQFGTNTVGIDPTAALIEEAKRRDHSGEYHVASAEKLPFNNASFDLVVSCLSLIDIPDIAAAISEMVRVLAPGGTLLIVNLTSFNTAGAEIGWQKNSAGEKQHYPVDQYMTERAFKIMLSSDVSVTNHHRPLSRYMQLLLEQGLILEAFDEPQPIIQDGPRVDGYIRAPWFNLMKWKKPF